MALDKKNMDALFMTKKPEQWFLKDLFETWGKKCHFSKVSFFIIETELWVLGQCYHVFNGLSSNLENVNRQLLCVTFIAFPIGFKLSKVMYRLRLDQNGKHILK